MRTRALDAMRTRFKISHLVRASISSSSAKRFLTESNSVRSMVSGPPAPLPSTSMVSVKVEMEDLDLDRLPSCGPLRGVSK